MPRWEASHFHKFFKNGYFVYLKNGQDFGVLLDNLLSYFLIIFHMPKF